MGSKKEINDTKLQRRKNIHKMLLDMVLGRAELSMKNAPSVLGGGDSQGFKIHKEVWSMTRIFSSVLTMKGGRVNIT